MAEGYMALYEAETVSVHLRENVLDVVGYTLLTLVNYFHPPLIQLGLLKNMWVIWNPW